MKTITLAEFKELAEHEDWEHSQETLWIEESERWEMDEDDINGVVITGGYGAVQKVSILDGIKITYIEHFEYDDFEPRSLKIQPTGDYDWNIEGASIVAKEDDDECIGILDLIEHLHSEFSEIDYTFLEPKLRRVTDVDDGEQRHA